MAAHPDQPDYSVPSLGPISKESRLSWRSQLSNNGTTPTEISPGPYHYHGKFFPRGCRGFIHELEIYVRNPAVVDDYVHVHFSPEPGMTNVFDVRLTVPALTDPGWITLTIDRFWNYDSLFIWMMVYVAGRVYINYDTGAPRDCYYSTDEENWVPYNRRLWIRVNFEGETAGDVPVSGTLNTIPIPNTMAMLHEFTSGDIDASEPYPRMITDRPGGMTAFQCCISKTVGTITPADIQITWDIDGTLYTDTLDFYLEAVEGVTNIHAPLNFYLINAEDEKWCFAFNFPVPCRQHIQVIFENLAALPNAFKVATWQAAEVLQ